MAKYVIDGTTLTDIADPIRAILGLTGGMTPVEMASNGTAVRDDVIAALNAIAEKGVTVPSGSTSDDLAALIKSISSAGGTMISGSFSPTSPWSISHTITHGLGITPNFACGFAEKLGFSSLAAETFVFHYYYKGTNLLGTVPNTTYPTLTINKPTTAITSSVTNGFGSATTNSITFKASFVSTNYPTVYYWIGVI